MLRALPGQINGHRESGSKSTCYSPLVLGSGANSCNTLKTHYKGTALFRPKAPQIGHQSHD